MSPAGLLNVEAMVFVVFNFDNSISSSLAPNALTLQPNLLCGLNDHLPNLSPFCDKHHRSAGTPPRKIETIFTNFNHQNF